MSIEDNNSPDIEKYPENGERRSKKRDRRRKEMFSKDSITTALKGIISGTAAGSALMYVGIVKNESAIHSAREESLREIRFLRQEHSTEMRRIFDRLATLEAKRILPDAELKINDLQNVDVQHNFRIKVLENFAGQGGRFSKEDAEKLTSRDDNFEKRIVFLETFAAQGGRLTKKDGDRINERLDNIISQRAECEAKLSKFSFRLDYFEKEITKKFADIAITHSHIDNRGKHASPNKNK